MRLVHLSPPILVASFAFLTADLAHFLLNGNWIAFSTADALAILGADLPASGFWLGLSPGWPLLVAGLVVAEVGLVQERLLALREARLMARLRAAAEEKRAQERHEDMVTRRKRRIRRILDRRAYE